MKKVFSILFFVLFPLYFFAQTNYNNGNEAYWNEKIIGFNQIRIDSGYTIFSYDSVNCVYRNGDTILIPNLLQIPNGQTVLDSTFYGFGLGGSPNNSNYQFDKQTQLAQPNYFDVKNLFVSPVSAAQMSYAKALQNTSNYCNYGNCHAIVDGPDSTLAYPNYNPQADTFNLWIGEDLINAGAIKGVYSQRISQQQLDNTPNKSYCVATYGKGWRLPTDIECGHFNDNTGINNGWHNSYQGTSLNYMWTSSLFKCYPVKRWPVRICDGTWENCAGFIYSFNRVRCVFAPPINIASISPSQTICKDDSAVIVAYGGGNYLWNTSDTTDTIIVCPQLTTTYTVTVTNGNYSGSAYVIIIVLPLPLADAGPPESICEGDSVVLSASGGGKYFWNTNDSTQSIFVAPAITTNYIVTVYDFGCHASDTVVVTVNPLPNVDLGNDTIICVNNTIVLTADTFDSYLWSTSETSQSITVDSTGLGIGTKTIYITVTENTCSNVDSINITFDPCTQINFLMPENTFSIFPNPSDGNVFISINDKIMEFEIFIMNTKGQEILHEKIYNNSERIKKINLSDYDKGIYFIKLVNENNILFEKIIVY